MKDPRACPSCGLWQRTERAAAVCRDPAHDAERGPAAGHQFHFAVLVQGSSSVVGVPGHTDAPEPHDEPFRLTVRAWNLRDACQAAAATPLHAWTFPGGDG